MSRVHISAKYAPAMLAALGLLAAAPRPVQAGTTALNVANNGFESSNPPLTGLNQTNGNTPPGWTFNGTSVDTSGNYFTGVQSGSIPGKTGSSYGFIYAAPNGFNLRQDITANGLNPGFNTIAGDTYTLTADVNTQNGAYAVLRLSDGNGNYLTSPVQSTAGFTTITDTFTATAGTSSSDLVLDLFLTDSTGSPSLGGTQAQDNFDNIRLTQTSPVPETSTGVSLGLLLTLGMGGAAVSARKRRATAPNSAPRPRQSILE